MKPGRELDALVAEKVFGLDPSTFGKVEEITMPDRSMTWIISECPEYSTSIAAAWEVVEKLKSIGIVLELDNEGNGWGVKWATEEESDWYKHDYIVKDTAPHTICLAALRAVGCEL